MILIHVVLAVLTVFFPVGLVVVIPMLLIMWFDDSELNSISDLYYFLLSFKQKLPQGNDFYIYNHKLRHWVKEVK